jgi:transposase
VRPYREEFRRKVLKYIRRGGSKAEAVRHFGLSRSTINQWLTLGDNLAPRKPGPPSKLDLDTLRKAVEQHPYRPNTEWAREFGVAESTIRYALAGMKLIRRRRPAAATVIDALKVAETHEFSFEPPAFMVGHEKLQRLACARSDEEGQPII